MGAVSHPASTSATSPEGPVSAVPDTSPPDTLFSVGDTLDRSAIGTGAITIALFAVPLAIGANVAADHARPGLALVCNLGVVAAFVVGSGCAAWIQRSSLPIVHGVVTALVTFTTLTALSVLYRIVTGQTVYWFRELFLATIVAAAGALGGVLGARLRSKGIQPRHAQRP